MAGRGKSRRCECVRRGPVRIRRRRHVVAAEEEETRRGVDVEARRASLTLARAREGERRRLERLATHAGDVRARGFVFGRRAVLLQVPPLVFLMNVALTQPVLPGSNTPGTTAADAETVKTSTVAKTPVMRSFFICSYPFGFRAYTWGPGLRKLPVTHAPSTRSHEVFTYRPSLGGSSRPRPAERTPACRRPPREPTVVHEPITGTEDSLSLTARPRVKTRVSEADSDGVAVQRGRPVVFSEEALQRASGYSCSPSQHATGRSGPRVSHVRNRRDRTLLRSVPRKCLHA